MNGAPGRGFFTGIVLMFIAIILIGAVVGIVISDLPQQIAEANRLRAETAWEARLHEQTGLQYIQAQFEVERQRNQEIAEAALTQQAEELRLAQVQRNQSLRAEAMLDYAVVFLLLLLGCSIIVVLTVTLCRVGWQLAEHMQAPAPTLPTRAYDPCQDVAWRCLRREEARQREQLARLVGHPAELHGMNGNGHYR